MEFVEAEEFFVDDLLDFSKGEEGGFGEEEDKKDTEVAAGDSVFLQESDHKAEKEKNPSDPPRTELTFPADDLADLEWLSHFVEDSFSGYSSLTYPVGNLPPEKPAEHRPEPPEPKSCFSTPVQTRARSKRARTGFRVWSLALTDHSSSSSSSSYTYSSSSSLSDPWLIYTCPGETVDSRLEPPPAKRQKKKQGAAGGSQQPRRCSHCLVHKTPQWRAGPLGPKTLCNACGVRYKTGRLLPEYRPACSPTFSSDFHSNNHRKVLEMRRRKETEAGPVPPVQSF